MALAATAAAPAPDVVEADLDHLAERGWVVVRGALAPDEVDRLRDGLRRAHANGWAEGLNAVGNEWFDTLLEREPHLYGPLIGHRGVRAHLDRLLGPQCMLRTLRGHLNPGPYTQEWHLDFYGYWHERRLAAARRYATPPLGINTTFYLQDNDPAFGRLTFIRGAHLTEPPHLYPMDRPAFEAWCEAQPKDDVHPKAGDCVLFLSHIPHQGAKVDPTTERGNVVLHYQACPMHVGAWHVTQPPVDRKLFPLA